MKNMKLAIGTLSSVLALAMFGGMAQAQASGIVRGDVRVGGGGRPDRTVTSTWHPIIYDHEVLSPSAPPRRLLIHADGTIRLVEGKVNPMPLASDRLDASSLAALKRDISAAAGDANDRLRTGAAGRTKSLSGGFTPSAGGPASGSAARIALKTHLDAMAAVLARNVVVASR